jgi:hypothetical protein
LASASLAEAERMSSHALESERNGFTAHVGFSQGWLGISSQDDGKAFGLAGGLGWFFYPRLAATIEATETVHPAEAGALTTSLVGVSLQWYFLRSVFVRPMFGAYWLSAGEVDDSDPDTLAEGWGARIELGAEMGRAGRFALGTFLAVEAALATTGGDHDITNLQIGFALSWL